MIKSRSFSKTLKDKMILPSVLGNRRRLLAWLGSVFFIYVAISFGFKASKEVFSSRLLINEFYGKEYVYNAPELKEKVIQDHFDVKGYLNLRKVFKFF